MWQEPEIDGMITSKTTERWDQFRVLELKQEEEERVVRF
jgi:hypothetical protein